ncbi:MAG: TldD/PmbA family protein [Desulfurococcales archaeon]|nr:TldD/PmbA family protein [Desulfurococcales archaeon]
MSSGIPIGEIASRTLRALEGEGYEAAVLVEAEKSLMIKLARGEISVTQSWNSLRTHVYVAKNKRMGVYTSTSPEPWRDLLESARLLSFAEESPLYAPLPEPTGASLSRVDEKIVEAVDTGDASFVIEDLELDNVGDAAGMVLLEHNVKHLVTSAGADLSHESTRFNGYLRVFRGSASGQWSWTSTVYEPATAKRAIGQAIELAEECAKLPRTKIEGGEYRILLGPMVAGNLLGEVVEAASAGMVLFGMSFLHSAKVGERVASEKLTIEDRPRDTSLPNFRGFDDEGVATQDKPIIERGEFKGFLHNSKTARVMKASSTGNAGWLIPTAFNIHVGAGDLKSTDILEALYDGVYITNNWYTRFQNYLEGEFSTVSRDAVIIVKRGEPAGCVERIRIADKLPRILSNIEDLSRDRWPIQWWEVRLPTLTPFVLIARARLSVAGP